MNKLSSGIYTSNYNINTKWIYSKKNIIMNVLIIILIFQYRFTNDPVPVNGFFSQITRNPINKAKFAMDQFSNRIDPKDIPAGQFINLTDGKSNFIASQNASTIVIPRKEDQQTPLPEFQEKFLNKDYRGNLTDGHMNGNSDVAAKDLLLARRNSRIKI